MDGLGIFDTQSPSDVLRHPIGRTMVEQSVTKIFLANPEAVREEYVERVASKLTHRTFQQKRDALEALGVRVTGSGQEWRLDGLIPTMTDAVVSYQSSA